MPATSARSPHCPGLPVGARLIGKWRHRIDVGECVLGTLIMRIVQTGTLIRSVQLLALANAPVAGKSLKASTKLRPPMSARPGTDSPLP